MSLQTAQDWSKGAMIFNTQHGMRHLPVRWRESHGQVGPESTWRALVAFSVDFALPGAQDRNLIYDAVRTEMSEVITIRLTSDYRTMIPCHICDISEMLESGFIEICSVDQQRLVMKIR